ncbi:McrC family protein [Amycolatopsis palatopharyngis]|uniref:McrC family protein n=1 Tax=Amycolatopsis palatopharyngis TaxID=187982 RepID=UPI000E2664BF|nr:restriction endonuclease [Amycolatopsis palatopharyngis]
MTTVEIAEHGTPQSVPLDDVTGRALSNSGIIDAAADPNATGRWRLRAKGKVGVANIQLPDGHEVTLRIRPKIPIARLLFLLGYSRSPKGWRNEHVQVDEERELLPAFARLFALQAARALRQRLLKGYRDVEETVLVIRGRIRHAEQVRRHHGRLIPLEIAHDEYTADIAENQLLRTACEVLLRSPGGIPVDVRVRLLRLRVALADATPIARGLTLPAWRPSRLNTRYHHALRLAELVLRNASIEHRPGDVTVNGFLFDMARVFEDFVTTALREALTGHGGHCIVQATHHLDEHNAIRLIPDFVRYAENGTPLAVADAKYKAEKPEGFPDADLYQMLAYCTALDLPEGHLVYAKGWDQAVPHGSHRVKNAGITIHQHALELDQPPSGLLHDIQMVAQRLGRRDPAPQNGAGVSMETTVSGGQT